MQKSRISMNKTVYERLILEDKSANPTYSSFMASLDRIMAMQNAIFSDPEKANKKVEKTDKKCFELLTAEYVQLHKLGLQLMGSNNSFVKARLHVINNIMKSANYDRELISEVVASGKLPQDIHRTRRSAVVKLTAENVKTIGGNSSQRIPISVSDGTKGFFTPTEHRFHIKARISLLEEYRDKLPKDIYKAFEEYITGGQWDKTGEALNDAVQEDKKLFTFDDRNRKNNVLDTVTQLGLPKFVASTLRKNDQYIDDVGNLLNRLGKASFVESFRVNWGISDGRDMAKRNVTMCDIADMMGCGHILAKSKPMTLIHNGVAVDGVFMENADGADTKNLPTDSPMYKLTTESISNPEFLHQLADLQILDLVCGNVDRHTANIIYDLKKDSNGRPYIAGLKGIDNDAAFTTSTDVQAFMTPVKFISHISRNMHTFLMDSSSPEKVKNMLLKNGYTRKEAEAAETRVRLLSVNVAKNPKVKVVEDNEWKDYNVSDLALESRGNYRSSNLYSKVYRSLVINLKKRSPLLKEEYAKGHIDFEQGTRVKKADAENAMLAKFAKHGDRMRTIDQLRKPSDEFKAMRDSLLEIENFAKERNEDSAPLTADEKQRLAEMTTALVNNCNNYISLKRFVPKTETGRLRQQYAYSLLGFATKMLSNGFEFNVDEDIKQQDKEAFLNSEQIIEKQKQEISGYMAKENKDEKELNDENDAMEKNDKDIEP